jgi:hypothetical protein
VNTGIRSIVILCFSVCTVGLWTARADAVAPPARRVESPALSLELSERGDIIGVVFSGGERRAVNGRTRLAGCRVADVEPPKILANGGVEWRKHVVDDVTGRECFLVERYTPTTNSVRWEIEIEGRGEPWTTPIETELRWPEPQSASVWAPWGDPDPDRASGWGDPLVPRPFADLRYWYGAVPYRDTDSSTFYPPWRYEIVSLPMATIIENGRDSGLSIVLSPEDTMLDMELSIDRTGSIVFSRLNHRLQEGTPVRFAVDLVAHEGDWRSALAWIVARYPQYFDPPNAGADAIAGTAAYSSYQGDLGVAKMKKMAFRVNWQASFEFPYMGMFLPPVGDNEEWTNFRSETTSFTRLNDYYKRMNAMGFCVLSYFNVTEFGARIKHPPPPRAEGDEPIWKNANDFLYTRLADAILHDRDGKQIWTWEGGIIVDPGEPVYRDFLLEQAKRHIEKTPATSGLAIDRTDWLRLYNTERDDGVSWYNGRPARYLLRGWNDLMAKLGPMMHSAGKSIFMNLHIKRLDAMSQIDGIFDEDGNHPGCANACAFLGLRKPLILWTASEEDLKPDPDAFFQRHLHLGAFPMAPFPLNDHSIRPSDWADRQYMDYGPLLDALRNRKWVLAPHAIKVEGDAAKANIFAVPGGYVIPVTFGGAAGSAEIVLRDLPLGANRGDLTCEVIHPGAQNWEPLDFTDDGAVLRIDVPLRRGCALVRLSGITHSVDGTG